MAREDAATLSLQRPALNALETETLRRQFGAACEDGSPVLRSYAIAELPVDIHFASRRAEARLARALAHLERADDKAPVLTISVWDAVDTPESAPAVPMVEFDEAQRGGVVHFDDGVFRMLYQPALRTLNAFDIAAAEGWFWAADAEALPEWECATPFRHVLHWWLAGRGIQQVHGAAVGDENGAVLIVGKGGSGKSTLAVNGAAAGLLYAGDDYVAVDAERLRVHSLYSSAKIDTDHFESFPEAVRARRVDPAAGDVEPFDREKTVVYLHESHPETMARDLPLRAIVMPRLEPGETRVRPTSRVKALAALAPSTVIQLHTAGRDALASMRRLVEQLPAFELQVGDGLSEPVHAISSLLRELEHGESAR